MNEPIAVLVVGAGPTGLTLAAELARRGVGVRLIDAAPAPTKLSKAIGVHARTLEILDDMGIAAALVDHGVQVTGAVTYANGTRLLSVEFDELDTRYPFVLCVEQTHTEAMLAAHASSRGVVVERGTELVELRDHGDAVEAAVRSADDGERVIRARWLVGCDGAHSVVRKKVGLDFEGDAYPDTFLLADVAIRWELARERIHSFFGEDGIAAVFPLPAGRARVVATAPSVSEQPDLDEVARILATSVHVDFTVADLVWSSRFAVHARQVGQYRRGRVFVAGDAAHIHSPMGGQGMNTGIQDAHNLAWKLALVHRGQAHESLLDSYHAERHRIGAEVLRATDVATRVATLRSPIARSIRNRLAGFLAALEPIQQRITRQVAQLHIDYSKSPIVEEHHDNVLRSRLGADADAEKPTVQAFYDFAGGPKAGQRAPFGTAMRADGTAVELSSVLDGDAFTLLLFDGRSPTPEGYAELARIARRVADRWGALVRPHLVVPAASSPPNLAWGGSLLLDPEGDLEHRYGASAECAYLVRPDLYVGFRSQPAAADRLMAHLERLLVDQR